MESGQKMFHIVPSGRSSSSAYMDTNPANRKIKTDCYDSESRASSSSRFKSLQLNKRSKNDNGEGKSTSSLYFAALLSSWFSSLSLALL